MVSLKISIITIFGQKFVKGSVQHPAQPSQQRFEEKIPAVKLLIPLQSFLSLKFFLGKFRVLLPRHQSRLWESLQHGDILEPIPETPGRQSCDQPHQEGQAEKLEVKR